MSDALKATSLCPGCKKEAPRWESRVRDGHELWLAICPACGWVGSYDATRQAVAEDPLTSYLGDEPLRQESPPWVRLYQVSMQAPWNYVWRCQPGGCRECDRGVVFESGCRSRPDFEASWSLCLACGYAHVRYLNPQWGSLAEMGGSQWTPPCPPIKKLRRTIFSRPRPKLVSIPVNFDEREEE